jgi:beta-glucosidase
MPNTSARKSSHRAEELLARMSLGEKAAQLQYHFVRKCDYSNAVLESGSFEPELKEKLETGLGNIFLGSNDDPEMVARTINAMQRHAKANTRLSIPIFVHCESLHGLMGKGATIYPSAPALAATWDVALVQRVFSAVALEARSRGIHITYAPVLDIATDARWGRSQETYGEDPYLNSEIGLACIKGYQGDNGSIAKDSVIACAKHFAGYGQAEGGRNFAPAHITRRDLLNKTLLPFRKVVQRGGIMGIMAGHHEIDGVPCHCNRELLTEILRDEWGFRGLVISDADDIHRLHTFHGVAGSKDEATALALRAGIDIEILRSNCFLDLERLVNEGMISETELDATVLRVLQVKFEMGLFDDSSFADPDLARSCSFSDPHRSIAKETSDKGIVLLENKNDLLPLSKTGCRRICVIGPNAKQLYFGTYSPKTAQGISAYDGIAQKCASLGIDVGYAKGCAITSVERDSYETELDFASASGNPELVSDEDNEELIQEAVRVAASSDVAVLCIGSNLFTSREAIFMGDHRGDRDQIDLPGSQELLVKRVAATGTPVVVFLFNGRPISTSAVADDIQGLFCCWALGCETGTSVADVLFGDVNPSGKMTVSIPVHSGQIPVHYNQHPSGQFRNYLFSDSKPQYLFGDGKSYTSFSYSNLNLDRREIGANEMVNVSVDVTNTGEIGGDEIVQLYISDDYSLVCRPVMELAGFQRVSIETGRSETVTFTLGEEALGYYGADYEFVVEPGSFTVSCGGSARELLQAKLTVK